ncbi:Calcium/proton antiporter [Serratia liquefaciens]|nr:Calcium/proton antiporter [Serratia liquefaciens]
MTHAHEAVKTRHKESSLVFPVLALAVLFFWGSSQSLPWLSRSISSRWSAF